MSSTKITEFDLDTSADIAKDSTLRENFETIDTLIAENENKAEEINEKIGIPAEAGQTLFSLLTNNSSTGLTAVKSIQRVTYLNETQSAEGIAVSIKKVNPANCIVLMELLCYPQDRDTQLDYVLSESSIAVTHDMASVQTVKLGFWVIEFN